MLDEFIVSILVLIVSQFEMISVSFENTENLNKQPKCCPTFK